MRCLCCFSWRLMQRPWNMMAATSLLGFAIPVWSWIPKRCCCSSRAGYRRRSTTTPLGLSQPSWRCRFSCFWCGGMRRGSPTAYQSQSSRGKGSREKSTKRSGRRQRRRRTSERVVYHKQRERLKGPGREPVAGNPRACNRQAKATEAHTRAS